MPTVSGRLSFSIVGLNNSHSRVVPFGSLHNGGRFYAAYQKRHISDTTIPFLSEIPRVREFADRILFKRTGSFHFVVFMKITDDQNEIRGMAGFVNSETWKSGLGEKFKSAAEKIQSLNSNFASSVIAKVNVN